MSHFHDDAEAGYEFGWGTPMWCVSMTDYVPASGPARQAIEKRRRFGEDVTRTSQSVHRPTLELFKSTLQ
jgi:hypothetical protein